MGQNAGSVSSVLILTHGRSGEEILKSAEMIMDKIDDMYAFSLLPGMSPEEYYKIVKEKLDIIQGNVLVIVDVFGGTPSNVAALLSKNYNISIVTGLNLPMLLEVVSLRCSISGEELANEIVSVGKDGCRNLLEMLKEV